MTDQHLPTSQIRALQDFGRIFNEKITELWEAVRPALAKMSEALHEAHDRGEHFYHDGKCIVCHTEEPR